MIGLRNLGRFTIGVEQIEAAPELVREMLAGCIVVRAEMLKDRNVIDYVAIHDGFAPVAAGEETPFYLAVIASERMLTAGEDGTPQEEVRARFSGWERQHQLRFW